MSRVRINTETWIAPLQISVSTKLYVASWLSEVALLGSGMGFQSNPRIHRLQKYCLRVLHHYPGFLRVNVWEVSLLFFDSFEIRPRCATEATGRPILLSSGLFCPLW
jgi:hypothetical protein